MPESACLEVHMLNVGQGDAILIVNRDTTKLADAVRSKAGGSFGGLEPLAYLPYAITNKVSLWGSVKKALLIDGGDDEYGGDVVAYLERYGVLDTRHEGYIAHLDVVVSHYHDDHIGGVRSIFKKVVEVPAPQSRTSRTKKSRTNVVRMIREIKPRYRPATIYYTTPDEHEDPYSQRLASLRDDIEQASTQASNPTSVVEVDPGGLVGDDACKISLGTGVDGIPIELTAFAAARTVYNPLTDRITSVKSATKTPDQNDRSIVFILQYGSFRCYLGGDIAGSGGADGGNTGSNAVDSSTKKFFSNHSDVESTLNRILEANLPATKTAEQGKPKFTVPGYCTVLKANHHASSSSVDVYTLSTVRPRVAVISAGLKARFHNHPTQQVMNRLRRDTSPTWKVRPKSVTPTATVPNTIDGIYITEVADTYKKKTFGVDIGSARIVGDVVIRPIDETISAIQQATSFGTRLKFQLYASGEQSGMDVNGTSVRDINAVGTDPYPVGPFTHECDLH